MKKLFTFMMLACLFSIAVLAKDGPFPMAQALGKWETLDQNMLLEISLSHYDKDKHAVLLIIAR